MDSEIHDFSSYSGWTENGNIFGGNPCHWDAASARNDQIYRTPVVDVSDGKAFQLWARFKGDGGSHSALTAVTGIFVKDSTNYVMAGGHQDHASTHINGTHHNVVTDPDNVFNPVPHANQKAVASYSNLFTTSWVWIMMEFDGVDQFDIYFVDDDTSIRPEKEDMTLRHSFTQAMGAIVQIGFYAICDAHFSPDFYFDDMIMITDFNSPVNHASIGPNSTLQQTSLYARNAIGQLGAGATLFIEDPFHEKGDDIEALLNTALTVSDTKWGIRFFQGEIKSTNKITKEINARGMMNKLFNTPCNYNPVTYRGLIQHITDDNFLYIIDEGPDKSQDFSGVSVGQLVVIKKTKPKITIVSPVHASYNNTISPYTTGITPSESAVGDIYNLFYQLYKDQGYSNSQVGLYGKNNDDFTIRMHFEPFLKASSTIIKAKLRLSIYHLTLDSIIWTVARPLIKIYDFNLGSYENLHEQPREGRAVGDDAYNESGYYEFEFDLEEELSNDLADYFEEQTANSIGNARFDFKVVITTGEINSLYPNGYESLGVTLAQLEIETEEEQVPQVGLAKVKTANTYNIELQPASAVSWMDVDAREDLLSIGDEFIICDSISSVFTNVMSQTGLDTLLDTDFEPTDELPESRDIRNISFGQWLQGWSQILNAAMWIDYVANPGTNNPTLKFRTTFDSTGLTLTPTHIVDWEEKASYIRNAEFEKTSVKLVGANGIEASVNNTIEHANGLGGEGIVITDPSIDNQQMLNQMAESLALLYKNAIVNFSFPLDLSHKQADYRDLQIGKTIEVKLPSDGSLINHTSGNDGILFIAMIELNRNEENGYHDVLTIYCIKRET